MNWDAAGAIGEIVGATAVVLTLVYLAKQIKDSSTQVKVNSLTALNTIYNDAFIPIYTSRENMNIWVTGLSSPEDLPDVEREILFMMRLIAAFVISTPAHRSGSGGKGNGFLRTIASSVRSVVWPNSRSSATLAPKRLVPTPRPV